MSDRLHPIRDAAVFFGVTYAIYLVVTRSIEGAPGFISYAPYVLVAVAGWIAGAKDNRGMARTCVLVGIVAAAIVGGFNLFLWSIGVPVDLGGFKWSFATILLAAPVFILLALLGGAVAGEVYGGRRT